MTTATLQGYTVGVTADRRAAEQGELLARRGVAVLHGPAIGTAYLGDDEALRAATADLIAQPPDLLVANTGIGMRSWFEAAQAWDLHEALISALSGSTVVARGPKAAGAAQRAGLAVGRHVASERLSEVRDVLLADGVAGRRVAVQLHGESHVDLIDELERAGATICPVPVYRWRMPDDRAPARRLVRAACDGRLDAVTFTSAPALRNLCEIAADLDAEDELLTAFNGGVRVVCVGPVCAEAARGVGVVDPAYPEIGRMGHMVRVLVEELQRATRSLSVAGCEVTVHGSTLSIDAEQVTLSPREKAIFHALAAAPGRVVAKDQLEQQVWGEVSRGSHRLHVNIGRLRKRLGRAGEAIEPVQGRGYRLNAELNAEVG